MRIKEVSNSEDCIRVTDVLEFSEGTIRFKEAAGFIQDRSGVGDFTGKAVYLSTPDGYDWFLGEDNTGAKILVCAKEVK